MHAKSATPIDHRDVLFTEARRSLGESFWGPRCGAALGILVLAMLAGCSESEPFPLTQISGKVTYEDGSLIDASSIKIICQPIDVEAQGKKSPRGAKGSVDPSTGQFDSFTTWKTGDGVICGRLKVAIVPMVFGKGDPMGQPNKKALHSKYFTTRTTPLEIEVVAGGDEFFELKVERPGK